MNWNRRYAIRSYLLSTIWTAPVAALVLEQATFRLTSMVNFDFGWVPGFALDKALRRHRGAVPIRGRVIESRVLPPIGRVRPNKPAEVTAGL